MNYAAIHIRAKEAQLDDQQYRSLLMSVAGVSSCKLLTEDQYRQVMDILWHRIHDRPRQTQRSPQERKVWALWYHLAQYLPATEQTTAYLTGFIRKVIGAPRFALGDFPRLTGKQYYKIIEALKIKTEQEIIEYEARQIPF